MARNDEWDEWGDIPPSINRHAGNHSTMGNDPDSVPQDEYDTQATQDRYKDSQSRSDDEAIAKIVADELDGQSPMNIGLNLINKISSIFTSERHFISRDDGDPQSWGGKAYGGDSDKRSENYEEYLLLMARKVIIQRLERRFAITYLQSSPANRASCEYEKRVALDIMQQSGLWGVVAYNWSHKTAHNENDIENPDARPFNRRTLGQMLGTIMNAQAGAVARDYGMSSSYNPICNLVSEFARDVNLSGNQLFQEIFPRIVEMHHLDPSKYRNMSLSEYMKGSRTIDIETASNIELLQYEAYKTCQEIAIERAKVLVRNKIRIDDGSLSGKTGQDKLKQEAIEDLNQSGFWGKNELNRIFPEALAKMIGIDNGLSR